MFGCGQEFDREAYQRQIDQAAARANEVNLDYRRLVDEFNAGRMTSIEISDRAAVYAGEFESLTADLIALAPPAELQGPHDLLISGFAQWQEYYRLQRDGIRTEDAALLEKAAALDAQAANAVNQALGDLATPG